MKHKLLICLAISLLSTTLIGCNKPAVAKKDISIIYTTDVHCGLDKNLGYASLYDYKEKLKETNYVTVVDSGDYLQGEFIGAISQGEYVMEVMNKVQYDIITLGNHEFDYGIDVLSERLKEFKGDVTSCNFSYIGKKENKLNMIKPYVIKDYGYKKVGFIGVTTPTTLTTSDPKIFDEDGKVAYDFGASSKEAFYSLVQKNIDNCKKDGADYVVLLSHLGNRENYSPYSSKDVLMNTRGVLAFLDGHAHIDFPWAKIKNKDNVDTLLVGAGYKLNEFASLTITTAGEISYEFVTKHDSKNETIEQFVSEIKQKGKEAGSKVIANIDIDLSIRDENGLRMIRNREMPIGNLVADAYRNISGSNISVVNGGGIRDDLKKGDVTYEQIMNVHPFGNVLMEKKTTGSKILDYLEFTSMKTQKERIKDNLPYGESGAFAQVSGIKYTIDTSIPTSVVTTESGEFVRIDGPRRVKNVQILENGAYVDIDANKEYTISSHNFLLSSGGDGANMFIDDPVIPNAQIFDYEVLIRYIVDILEGHLSEKYSSTDGRINVI